MLAIPDQLDGLGPGRALPPLIKPRLTSRHIARWLAAQQNWDRIHYDQAYCRDFAQLPGPVINGALKQHLIVQFLSQAFDGMGWVWRVQYRFVGADLVGQMLQVQGLVVAIDQTPECIFVSVVCEILNLDQHKVTTRGEAVVVLSRDRTRLLDGLSIRNGPVNLGLQTEPADDGSAPEEIRQRIGEVIETRTSAYSVDLSRLRLFADAVMGLSPIFFDPVAAARGPYAEVVAPPLFPLHGIEAVPDTLPFSEAPGAMGRESVNEVGRDPSSMFGLATAGGMNAGNHAEVHSLVRAGERIGATSMLAGARCRQSREGGRMLFVETVNRYTETGGRPLVTERQTILLKLA